MPKLGLVQHVVVDEGRDVYQFHDDGQRNVLFPDAASRTARQ